jgi:hypothetical protein
MMMWTSTEVHNIRASATQILSYYEFKQYKILFDKGFSKLLGQKKLAKLHCLQNPSQIIADSQCILKR